MGTRIARDRSEFDRGLGFFDAVYGFAITLLIANIDMPPASAWQDLSTLVSGELGAQLTGFVISFVVIAMFWKANTDLVGKLSGMDGSVIIANLVTVGLIVFIPFTTQGISDDKTSVLPLPTALYAVNVAAAILSQAIMFEIARMRGLVEDDVPRGAYWIVRLDVLSKIAVFLVSIPIAYLAGPQWGWTFWLLLIAVGPLMARWRLRVEASAMRAEPLPAVEPPDA